MTTKRVPPLNNPPSERAVAVAPVKTLKRDDDDKGMGGGRAREGGGRGRGRVVEALLKCQMCGRIGKVVFAMGKAPAWHRCPFCRELQPTDGYRVVGYGLGLPTPLYPHELEARKREAEHDKIKRGA